MFSIRYTNKSGHTYEVQVPTYGEALDEVTCLNEEGCYPVKAQEFEGPAHPGGPRRIQ